MYGITSNEPNDIGGARDEDLQSFFYIMREARNRSRLTVEQVAEIIGRPVRRVKDLIDGEATDATVSEVSAVVAACGYRLASAIATFERRSVCPWNLYRVRVIREEAGVNLGSVLGAVALLHTWRDDQVLSELELQGFLEQVTPKTTLSTIVVRAINTKCYSMQVNEGGSSVLRLDYLGTLNSVVPTVGEAT